MSELLIGDSASALIFDLAAGRDQRCPGEARGPDHATPKSPTDYSRADWEVIAYDYVRRLAYSFKTRSIVKTAARINFRTGFEGGTCSLI